MSHWIALVIGDNPEQQLAPYHDFECTGKDDQYVRDVDETGLCLERYRHILRIRERNGERPETFAAFCTEGSPAVPPGKRPDLEGVHKYGYTVVDERGEVVRVIRRTNPDRKWEYCQLGGLWEDFFRLRDGAGPAGGGRACQARKGDIDFAAMRREAEAEAARRYDAVRAVIGPLLPVRPWEDVLREHLAGHGEDAPGLVRAREIYQAQPAVKAFAACEFGGPLTAIEPYLLDRDAYIRAAGSVTAGVWAVVRDSRWHERRPLGWWGPVVNEWDDEAWARLIDGLPAPSCLFSTATVERGAHGWTNPPEGPLPGRGLAGSPGG